MDSSKPLRDATEGPIITIRIFAGRYTPPQQQALIARVHRALRIDRAAADGPAPHVRLVEVHAHSRTVAASPRPGDSN